MNKFLVLLASVLVVLLMAGSSTSAPAPFWFDELFPSRRSNSNPSQPRAGRALSGAEQYKRNCRIINPDPYAFPGKIPFPSVPVCPY
ncbi:Hypothetical protein NTJ_09127 [Nesidiocoris tenuis]|uniref:Uncharacterized protein n=1 Tax=Nesidiocoris tenuis TaxID=355587 RepID=A0ABN7AWD3_9HEMI|nr:Hypothetical protein NTJ_09127 [Nesidiocoris tenuis]